MKKYDVPEMEVVQLERMDVVRTSFGEEESGTPEGEPVITPSVPGSSSGSWA